MTRRTTRATRTAMKLHTKAGDGGETSLLDGRRVRKCDARVEACGGVDELSSWLGVVVTHLPRGAASAIRELREAQRVLVRAGAVVAVQGGAGGATTPRVALGAGPAGKLEAAIARMQSELPDLAEFILPGGCVAAAWTHVARTVCRRAERAVVRLRDAADGSADAQLADVLAFLNRLGDYLFTLARGLNHRAGTPETGWRATPRRKGCRG